MVRPAGLGKGLGALIPIGAAPVEQGNPERVSAPRLAYLPIAAIKPNVHQPRNHFDEEGLSALAASIKELGVLQPILVRPGADGLYELIAGERRWRAASRAGLDVVPAIVREVDDAASLEQALVENLHRTDLNPLEEAAAFQQLIDDFGLTHDDVAGRVGKSRAAVTNALRLMQLSPTLQRMVLEQQLTAGHARALLSIADRVHQEAMARKVIAEGLSVRAVEEAARARAEMAEGRSGRKGRPKSTDTRPASLVELEELLSGHLDTKVQVSLSAKRGRIVIDFADLDDLERIFTRISSS